MHGIHGSVARRLEAVARLLGAAPLPETDAEAGRRAVFVKAAHAGETPADLQESERLTFQKIVASIPIFEELIADGLVDGHGEPSVVDDLRDETEDGELAWSP